MLNNKDVVPYQTIACASIHWLSGGDFSIAEELDRWTEQVCQHLRSVVVAFFSFYAYL
jgi:hypothetical protein